jgi:hypothetical protein
LAAPLLDPESDAWLRRIDRNGVIEGGGYPPNEVIAKLVSLRLLHNASGFLRRTLAGDQAIAGH